MKKHRVGRLSALCHELVARVAHDPKAFAARAHHRLAAQVSACQMRLPAVTAFAADTLAILCFQIWWQG